MAEPVTATKVGVEKTTTVKLMEGFKAIVADAEEVKATSLIF